MICHNLVFPLEDVTDVLKCCSCMWGARSRADRCRGVVAIFNYLYIDWVMQRRQCSCHAPSGGQQNDATICVT